MENSISSYILPILSLLIVWTLFLEIVVHSIVRNMMLYFKPIDIYDWPKRYLGKKIKFQHPVYKGVEGVGTIVGIRNTKEKGKGGVPKYKLDVDEGSGSITPIWLDSKWEYSDAKDRP
jgi:hypothetical protein